MGYTHYFPVAENAPEEEVWAGYRKALPILRDIAGRHREVLCLEYDAPYRPPEVSEACIYLNGRGDDGYEAFFFDPADRGYQFCKTEKRPYDLPVCEMLIVLHHYVPGLKVRSDGFWLDFEYDEKNGILGGLEANWQKAINEVKNRYGLRFRYLGKRTDAPRGKKDGSQAQYREVKLISYKVDPPFPTWTVLTLGVFPPTLGSAFFD